MLRDYYDKHLGETCIVIGNGGSLRDVPIDFLGKVPTFGTNRIYLLPGFEPTYYVSVNPLVIEQCQHEINCMGSDKFIPAGKHKLIHGSNPILISGYPEFSFDPLRGFFEGWTVTFVCLELAFFMGFKTVLLVGVDHRYEFHGSPNTRQLFRGEDPNHFDPNYFTGKFWHTPDLERSNECYEMADKAYRRAGRKIINLTPGSGTDAFEKQDITSWC